MLRHLYITNERIVPVLNVTRIKVIKETGQARAEGLESEVESSERVASREPASDRPGDGEEAKV